MAGTDVVPIGSLRRGGRSPRPAQPEVDARALAEALSAEIDGEVRFDDGSRALYATDGSNYRQVPIGVVIGKGLLVQRPLNGVLFGVLALELQAQAGAH